MQLGPTWAKASWIPKARAWGSRTALNSEAGSIRKLAILPDSPHMPLGPQPHSGCHGLCDGGLAKGELRTTHGPEQSYHTYHPKPSGTGVQMNCCCHMWTASGKADLLSRGTGVVTKTSDDPWPTVIFLGSSDSGPGRWALGCAGEPGAGYYTPPSTFLKVIPKSPPHL